MHTSLISNKESKNEIDLLGVEFNSMMMRINDAYQKQKEFTANASHELRTPLTRMLAQIENHSEVATPNEKLFLKKILSDIIQLNELVNSLLILSKLDSGTISIKERVRLDEALYNSIDRISADFPDFKVSINIDITDNMGDLFEVECNQNLLEIVFANLLKNACMYSSNKSANINFIEENKKITIQFSNIGEPLNEKEQLNLFKPFMRGNNAKNISGLGLGLKIVKRILTIYGFHVSYQANGNVNNFKIQF
jgi:signal transduction histidine kinase